MREPALRPAVVKPVAKRSVVPAESSVLSESEDEVEEVEPGASSGTGLEDRSSGSVEASLGKLTRILEC